MEDFEITKNMRQIETFKSQLLSNVAELYESLLDGNRKMTERTNLLSDIVIVTYLLSEKLGVSYNALDMRILNQIKLGILKEKGVSEWQTSLALLAKHIDKSRDITK